MADLELHNIGKTFGKITVLSGISLKVPHGQFTIFLGPSGCGKSTLLRIMAGLETQTKGNVSIDGKNVDTLSPRERDIAMVFQNYALYPHLTVRENLAFGLKMRRESREVIEDRIRESGQLLNIDDLMDRKPRELSGGQRQRVAMGRAIVRKPKLFLFDEPLSNLDAQLRVSMRLELKKLHKRLSTTMIYVTHDQTEAMTLGEKIVVMNRGRIQQVDTADRIYSAPSSPFVAGFIGSPAMNLFEGSLNHKDGRWVFHSGPLTIALSKPHEPTLLDRTGPAILGIRPEDITLKDSDTSEDTIKGELEMIENLGSDRIFHVISGNQRLVVRAPHSSQYRSGDTVSLHLPYHRLHLFINDQRIEISKRE